ncbi:glucose-1-phosphate cytidylyltransferase [Paenibacillus phyllosphaerae]|uniref:Glucose-1-phosphate cytidylyltransferase n=1 Tax=Paenibacillus phyllosphaerae TaxID=274593 RepID=A0A7W5ASU1_9BACL|nr:glucose-1-phosphate cytidylyltransferase [Paenibacillus phyllosphaerae]MBB3108124.1 glucose-1-phosphate cytidylyltransferase [Paenibacillus phyllosphaerae]
MTLRGNKPPVAILCGGYGSRLSEETARIPKPMIEIGELPMVCHIMNIYASYGFTEFYLLLGYKADYIKRYFLHFPILQGDFTVHTGTRETTVTRQTRRSDWIIHLVDTGMDTTTGGRLGRLKDRIDGTFMMTYGDGVSDVSIPELLAAHASAGTVATVTAIRASGRFGMLACEADNRVVSFEEKPQTGDNWINGGFFVFEPSIFDYLEDDFIHLEGEVLGRLSQARELTAYKHEGFWACMDTLRDKQHLERLWQEGRAPWKIWRD